MTAESTFEWGGEVASSRASRGQLRLSSSRAHGLQSGNQVRISGVKSKTGANGTFTVTRIDDNKFSLNGGSDANAYAGGGVWGAGDWQTLGVGLQVAEFHNIAYDHNTHSIIAGAQDNGTQEQDSRTGDSQVWNLVSGGDGGDVAVDNESLKGFGQSIRYSSNQNLSGFQRRVLNANGEVVSQTYIYPQVDQSPIGASLTVTGATNAKPIVITAVGHRLESGNVVTISGVGGNTAANGTFYVGSVEGDTFQLLSLADLQFVQGSGNYTSGGTIQRIPAKFVPQFVTPITLNANQPNRMILIGQQAIHESFNYGSTLKEVGPGAQNYNLPPMQNAIAYGDKPGGAHPNVLYVGMGRRWGTRLISRWRSISRSTPSRSGWMGCRRLGRCRNWPTSCRGWMTTRRSTLSRTQTGTKCSSSISICRKSSRRRR